MSDPTTEHDAREPLSQGRVLYCHCAFAKVVPEQTKAEVLERLGGSDAGFDAVPDLCEMSARRDPALANLASDDGSGTLKIAACFPRAVKWLFHAAGTPLPEDRVEFINMRELSGAEAADRLLGVSSQADAQEEARS